MEIILNNKTENFQEQCSVQQLLDEIMPGKQKGIAVAVNQAVVPKAQWGNFLLKENDNVLIIKATQGG